MPPRIPQMDIFVILIHVWYPQNRYLPVFSQFRIYLGLFLLKNCHVGVFTSGFGLKEGPNDPYNPVDVRPPNNIWYTWNRYLPIFLQFRIYLGLFLQKNYHAGVVTHGLGLKEGSNDPYNPVDGYVRALPIFLQFRIYIRLFLLKKR